MQFIQLELEELRIPHSPLLLFQWDFGLDKFDFTEVQEKKKQIEVQNTLQNVDF